jgi:cytochrome c biogenesis protein CcdA
VGASSLVLAFLAGGLSILSPCVLPILPIVLGAAAGEHRLAPLALAAGLALSFTAVGLFVATIGFAIGLDGEVFRAAAALILIGLGVVLMVPAAQARLAVAAAPIGAWTENRFGGFAGAGVGGQFGVGLLLGAVWSPCVGPTLGAASVLAARGEDLTSVAAVMLAFGIGAGLPLAVLGTVGRPWLVRMRTRLLSAGALGKTLIGVVLVVVALAVLAGLDKRAEAWLVEASPDWLTRLTTRF